MFFFVVAGVRRGWAGAGGGGGVPVHPLRRGVRAPEQAHAAHPDYTHAGHSQVPRRHPGPAAAAADGAVPGAHVPVHAARGARRPGHRPRRRKRRPLQVLRQKLPGRFLADRPPAGAHGRQTLQM